MTTIALLFAANDTTENGTRIQAGDATGQPEFHAALELSSFIRYTRLKADLCHATTLIWKMDSKKIAIYCSKNPVLLNIVEVSHAARHQIFPPGNGAE